MDAAVIVVGAGPTGMMVAAELGLAGMSAVVLDGAAERSRQSKAGSIQPRTAEVFEARGLLAPLLPSARRREPVGGHFAALPVPLDCRDLRTRFPYPVSIPQYALETFLERQLGRYPGVSLRRGCTLTDIATDEDGVTATVRGAGGESTLRARYLVGADGGHSTVRRLTGVEFPGRPGRISMVASDIRLTGLDDGDEPSGHFSRYLRQGAILSPLGEGMHRFMFPGDQDADRSAPVTHEEVAAALRAVCGPELELAEVRYATRFSDASRQAERYRLGRVLLAGDAAHIHLPAGGQGINLGVQDAINLGWKLAAQARGVAPDGLLDTYHTERHPVAARVLLNTRAQGVLMGAAGDTDVAALRSILTDLMRLPDTNRYLSGMISGLDTRYEVGGADHPLLGARLPDLDLVGPDGPTRVSALLRAGHGLLLDLGAGLAPAASSGIPVDTITATLADGEAPIDATAVLVRPDGHVVATDADGPDGLAAALHRWFTPAPALTPA